MSSEASLVSLYRVASNQEVEIKRIKLKSGNPPGLCIEESPNIAVSILATDVSQILTRSGRDMGCSNKWCRYGPTFCRLRSTLREHDSQTDRQTDRQIDKQRDRPQNDNIDTRNRINPLKPTVAIWVQL